MKAHLKTYLVGGSVRDELLGLPVVDHDYVVVGSTPEEMASLGYRPVGKDFPVFLHPKSHEQYALARTERKVARGYKGFEVYASPEVTLQEDLARRDLTINAIAKDRDGNIIDPFGGVADLKAGLLRHVSPAFAEDPVRVLRVARFAARFNFGIAPETFTLMIDMVRNGEVDALVPERVWQELARGLMERQPSRMFQTLRECGALARVMPEVDALFGVPQPAQHHPEIDTGVHVMLVIDYAASKNYSLPVRFAALTHDLGKGATPPEEWPRHIGHEARSAQLVKDLCGRIKAPSNERDLAVLVARYHGDVHRAMELRPVTIAEMLHAVDAYRKPERFEEFLQACACDFHGRSADTALPEASGAGGGAKARSPPTRCEAPRSSEGRHECSRVAAAEAGFASNESARLDCVDKPYPQADRLRAAFAAARSVDAGAIAAGLAKTVSDPARLPGEINARVRAARIAEIKILFG